MSFQDLEVGRRPIETRLMRQIEREPSRTVVAGVFKINTAVADYKVQTPCLFHRNSQRHPLLRRKLLEIGEMANETSAAFDHLIRESAKSPRADARKKICHAKLTKDYEAVLKEFEKAQVLEAERDRNFAPPPPPPPVTNITLQPSSNSNTTGIKITLNGNHTSLSNRKAVTQLESEITLNEAIIEEWEQGIREVQQQIDEVNEIFRDLAVLVRKQASLIDDVTLNIEHSHYSS